MPKPQCESGEQGQNASKVRPPPIPRRRKVIYTLVIVFATYSVGEAIATYLYLDGILEPRSIWIQEDTGAGPTIMFDPIRGFRLTGAPSRMACVASNGVIESVGEIRGNNLGFPDRNDFERQRPSPQQKRFVVFGDSFTAAQFLSQNWPDKAEDLTREKETRLQLWNCAVDGGGILNWWSILTRLIAKEDFEFDGLVFAVWGTDLRRGFIILDDRVVRKNPDGQRSIAEGRVNTTNPAFWPSTVEEAAPYFHNIEEWRVLPTEQFDRVLEKNLRIKPHRPFRLYLLHRCGRGIARLSGAPPEPGPGFVANPVPSPRRFDPARKRLMSDILRFTTSRNIPVVVVHVPRREDLLAGVSPSIETQSFAKYLGAKFLDGSVAFQNLSKEEIRNCFLPYDGHWNQQGSDRFAQYMAEELVNALALP